MGISSANAIALDFDGVLANTGEIKSRWILNAFGINTKDAFFDRSSLLKTIGYDNYLLMQKAIGYEDTLLASPLPGALDGVEFLSQNYSIHIITARQSTKLPWVERWLDQHGLKLKIHSVRSSSCLSKISLLRSNEYTAIVDDDLRHLLANPQIQLDRYWFGRSYSEAMNFDSEFVKCALDWPDLVEKISRSIGSHSSN